MDQQAHFDAELIRRYDKAGPRYTSYPTAVQFTEDFGEADYRAFAEASNTGPSPRPLSLYFHIPFCDTVCFYCACNKVVTKDRGRASPYLQRLYWEIALQASLFDRARPVDQLHWGGGTPTFLSHQEMAELMSVTGEHFRLRDDDAGEYSIEVDPREADPDTIRVLREIGFNRLSMGVQDFDPKVQKAVNRIQSEEQTFSVMDAARAQGFRSVSLDLIYGLPFQNMESFGRTLDKIIAVKPDRLSVFNYAHLPDLFKPQRRINAEDLPSPGEKLKILQHTIEKLQAAGYVYIGMDHFARPDDELAIAQREGTLYRNFQGYSTHADCDLIAIGITGISMVGNSYAQNLRTVDEYYERVDADRLAVFRGIALEADDLLRREIITQLICHFALDIPAIEAKYGIDFGDYFPTELEELKVMEKDGLLTVAPAVIKVRPAGRLLIRNICMVFDRYLRQQQERRYSRVI
ncbi:MAG: oxygen-independent coproporphyrinogen III oxidase [Gammaproteobacteria bacterium]|nr:oxygen-independent coproporphyrinogen III oxidase [Gammaproteobacteria bacterium]NIR96932.1 oxygen-independent coproporphyrinogen III oxidase [Gammaproteobacteria bacterium]NIT62634.1 oxygen-independent coproporphyrinogen III oxidase [Gammaproteobacteria bacterium]NIV19594.1 oxygen-independent coproporphyrinogen III oxidase [Gammaproteobacteria bacterium]NIX10814.1 oxygen-independent coproporphyrinogen III oxidase [Gammaproteobacteria bacterium]